MNHLIRLDILAGILLLLVLLYSQNLAAREIFTGSLPFDVLRIIDGDTVRARVKIWLGQSITVNIRLKGIDTPEINGKCDAEKKLARRAKAFTRSWLRQKKLHLTNVQPAHFRGRVLGTIRTEKGKTLSMALLSAKLAKPYKGRKAKWCA